MDKITFDFTDIENITVNVDLTDIDKFGKALRKIMNTSMLMPIYLSAYDKVMSSALPNQTSEVLKLKTILVQVLSEVLHDIHSLVEEHKTSMRDEDGEEIPLVDPELVFATGEKTNGT